jgi:hypothetical protein
MSRSTTIRTEESKKTHQVNGGEVEMWRNEPTPYWPEQLHEKKGKVWMLGKGEGRRRLRNPRERAESLNNLGLYCLCFLSCVVLV